MSPLASTRWCPTTEQLMILEEMYKGGIKTPTASQIQQITAHLSVFGKIEGKNVFYWFQNHKARDRQKLRRKLISKKQQQQQQQSHHVLHQFEASGSNTTAGLHQFHPYSNSSSFLPHQEGPKEATIPQVMMNYKRKMDNSQQMEEEKWVWLRGQDNWMNTTNAATTTTTTTTTVTSADPLHSSCCTRPLITLELFPIKSTSLKDENFTTPNA